MCWWEWRCDLLRTITRSTTVRILYTLYTYSPRTRLRWQRIRKESEEILLLTWQLCENYAIMFTHRTSETEPKEKKREDTPCSALCQRRDCQSYPQGYPQANEPNIRSYEQVFVLSAPNISCRQSRQHLMLSWPNILPSFPQANIRSGEHTFVLSRPNTEC